jgi:hypothetical protein
MTYANPVERANLIAGLHALADFLEEHPDVPAPRWADVMVFPIGTDAEMQTEIDEIATRLSAATIDATTSGGHYTTTHAFGPVEYKAIAIPANARAHRSTDSEWGEGR